MSRHGGARRGAGRPRKWHLDDVLRIGQACECKWREASEDALAARLSALPHADQITRLHKKAQAIPVPKRRGWLASEAYEDHSGDIDAFLHDTAGTPFDDETATFEGETPRVVTLSTKPPKGTRRRIIKQIAEKSGLPESAVDNLWQAYRRFERELRHSAET